MSKSAKHATPATGGTDDVPFEDGLRKLESVVQAMESDELPLETLLARYEEGVRLLEACQRKLAAAEVKISQLEQQATDAAILTPMDAAAPADEAD